MLWVICSDPIYNKSCNIVRNFLEPREKGEISKDTSMLLRQFQEISKVNLSIRHCIEFATLELPHFATRSLFFLVVVLPPCGVRAGVSGPTEILST